MLSDHIEFLRERLKQPNVNYGEVIDYIILAHQPLHGQLMQDPLLFVKEDDLVAFRWLHEWWEPFNGKPVILPTPTIAQFCWYVNYIEGQKPLTFLQAIMQFHKRAVDFCTANDVDPDNPGESAEERKIRRNRVRMAKVRESRKVPSAMRKGLSEYELGQLSGFEMLLDATKAQAKAEDDRLRQEVLVHQSAMIAASDNRKLASNYYKTAIENIRADIHKITAKQ